MNASGIWGLRNSTSFLAACWMIARIFPYHYAELMKIDPPATKLLPGRNLLLTVLWPLMLSLPPGEKQEPSETSSVAA